MPVARTLDDLVVSSKFDVDEIEACLRTNGAAVLPSFASQGVVQSLRQEFRAALEDKDGSYAFQISYAPGHAVSIMREKMPEHCYPAMSEFFGQAKMQYLCDRYVGHPQRMNYEIYATHEFLPEVDIAPTHFDKLWTLKYMLYLNDIAIENGAFGVIPGSQKRGREIFRSVFTVHNLRRLQMSDDRYHGMGNDRVPSDLGPVVDIVGPSGTLIIFDTDTFHHAGSVTAGHERMILRAHTGPSVIYSSVRKGSRQWWRGEKRFSRFDAVIDRVADVVMPA
jgi:hypothetical protein